MNYNPSTIARIGDINRGLFVETSVLLGTAYMIQAAVPIFSVYGRIKILELYGEVTTVISTTATTMKFTFVSTTPVIAIQDLSAASDTMSDLVVGSRAVCTGTTVATKTAIVPTGGVSYAMDRKLIVGTTAGIGSIGQTTAGANMTGTAAMKFALCWVAMEDGAYAAALL